MRSPSTVCCFPAWRRSLFSPLSKSSKRCRSESTVEPSVLSAATPVFVVVQQVAADDLERPHLLFVQSVTALPANREGPVVDRLRRLECGRRLRQQSSEAGSIHRVTTVCEEIRLEEKLLRRLASSDVARCGRFHLPCCVAGAVHRCADPGGSHLIDRPIDSHQMTIGSHPIASSDALSYLAKHVFNKGVSCVLTAAL
mmetsp:Transcript_43325/g.122774  ORF Transcript_43325/g.122774 Transcript_43325/m.122774 type:complete len:198 (+) Transcript_43325:281-874(+)